MARYLIQFCFLSNKHRLSIKFSLLSLIYSAKFTASRVTITIASCAKSVEEVYAAAKDGYTKRKTKQCETVKCLKCKRCIAEKQGEGYTGKQTAARHIMRLTGVPGVKISSHIHSSVELPWGKTLLSSSLLLLVQILAYKISRLEKIPLNESK